MFTNTSWAEKSTATAIICYAIAYGGFAQMVAGVLEVSGCMPAYVLPALVQSAVEPASTGSCARRPCWARGGYHSCVYSQHASHVYSQHAVCLSLHSDCTMSIDDAQALSQSGIAPLEQAVWTM